MCLPWQERESRVSSAFESYHLRTGSIVAVEVNAAAFHGHGQPPAKANAAITSRHEVFGWWNRF